MSSVLEREIHKVDKLLIRSGVILIILAFFATSCGAGSRMYTVVHESGTGTNTSHHWRALGDERTLRAQYPDAISIDRSDAGGNAFWYHLLLGGFLLLAAGIVVLRKENRALRVWNFIEQGVDVTITDLCQSTGIERRDLSAVLSTINAQPGAFYIWDKKADKLVNGLLRDSILVIENCEGCGGYVNTQVSLDLRSLPMCDYCGKPVSQSNINDLRQSRLAEIRKTEHQESKREFSPVVFVLLLLFFWPAALFYAIWKSGLVDRFFTADEQRISGEIPTENAS